MDKRFDKLPDDMKVAILVLEELHNIPESMALPVVLGVANLAAQAHYDVDSGKYGVRPISLFLLSMAATGGRKTTTFKELMVGIQDFLEQKRDELKDEDLRYNLEKKKFEREERQWLKDSEDPLNLVLPPMPQRPAPMETADYTINKGTLNGIVDTLKSQSFVGLFSSEGGEFFNSHSFQGGKNEISRAVEMSASLTSMWDGTEITKTTGMERVKLFNRRVNMLFLLQTETVESMLNNPIFSEQGFVHRILITQSPKYNNKEWENSEESDVWEAKIRESLKGFHKKTRDLISRKLTLKPNKPFELEPTLIRQTRESKQIYVDFYNKNLNRSSGDLKNFAGFAERLHEHAIRIAGTLAAFEGLTEITKEIAECSLDLIDFFIEQRLSLELGIQNINPIQTQGTNKLVQWFEQHPTWRGTHRELRQANTWFGKLSQEQREALLNELMLDEIITAEQEVALNGRTKIIYALSTDQVKPHELLEKIA